MKGGGGKRRRERREKRLFFLGGEEGGGSVKGDKEGDERGEFFFLGWKREMEEGREGKGINEGGEEIKGEEKGKKKFWGGRVKGVSAKKKRKRRR